MSIEPICRIALTYPIYAMDILEDGTVVVAGGGGKMKSGIPNACHALRFNEATGQLSSTASVDLPDVAVSLASIGNIIHTVLGPGIKSFSFDSKTISPLSSFHHDIRISSSQGQAAIAVSECGSTMVVASEEGSVVSLRLPRYEPMFSSCLHSRGISDISISHDGSLVATTARDRTALIWNSNDGQIVQALKPVMPAALNTHIRAIRFFKSDPDIIFTVEGNPRKGAWIVCWRKSGPSPAAFFVPAAPFKVSNEAVTACAVSPCGSVIATSTAEGHVSLIKWNGASFSFAWSTQTRTGCFSVPQPPHVLPVTGMRFSKSNKYIFTASADYTVTVWSVQKPINWRGIIWNLLVTVLTVSLMCFAVLLAEEDRLYPTIRHGRARIEPYLEPHLFKIRMFARPFLSVRRKQVFDRRKPSTAEESKPLTFLEEPNQTMAGFIKKMFEEAPAATCEGIIMNSDTVNRGNDDDLNAEPNQQMVGFIKKMFEEAPAATCEGIIINSDTVNRGNDDDLNAEPNQQMVGFIKKMFEEAPAATCEGIIINSDTVNRGNDDDLNAEPNQQMVGFIKKMFEEAPAATCEGIIINSDTVNHGNDDDLNAEPNHEMVGFIKKMFDEAPAATCSML